MKKSKLSISLVATFVAALGMSSCSDVSSDKQSILDFKGYDGISYKILTDEMYADYQTTENITKFYNPILEVMIRNEFAKEDSPLAKKKSYATIKQEAERDVKDQKDKAEDSDESYNTAWENILDSYGVEDEDELLEHFIYEREKEAAEDWYYETYKEYLTKEWLGVTADGSAYQINESTPYPYVGGVLQSKFPYHIRHILVKTDGSGSEYGVDKISSDNAYKLANIVDELLDGNKTFGQIAFSRSDDGSASSYGEVDIMDNSYKSDEGGALTMVNEFQLGLYAYDVLLGSNRTKNTAATKAGLGISEGVESKITAAADNKFALKDNTGTDGINGLTRVPASVFARLAQYAEKTTSSDGYNLANGKEEIYPRNILWNKYLNHHNPFIITNNESEDCSASVAADGKSYAENYNANINTGAVAVAGVTGKCGYRSAKALGLIGEAANDFGVLCDENNNVIIGVRSQFGIHFMVIQKSILDFTNGEGNNVSLEQYYTTLVPSDSDFPKDSAGNNKSTYVTYINSTNPSDYTTRAEKIKSAIKSYDSTYEYRLFEELYEMNKSSFNLSESGKKLIENIQNYIQIQRESKIYTQTEGIAKVWDKYFEKLEQQNTVRTQSKRVIPEGCIVGFNTAFNDDSEINHDAYKEGGVCYYGK